MVRIGFIVALLGATLVVYANAFPDRELRVSFLNVGQGDAIFIQGPTGVQMLVDGGPSTAVLRELGKTMPFFDRSLDAVIATHPDSDHIAGLVYVMDRYDVRAYLAPGIPNDTAVSSALQKAVLNEGIEETHARRGMRLTLGGGAYADILFPDRDVSRVETNTGSVVARIVYGDTEFLLTGDAPKSIERYLAVFYPDTLTSDVLKAGHHGSRTSSDELFIDAVKPRYAIVSRGCENRYGHPAAEVVERFLARSITILDTCLEGTVTFSSDGTSLTYTE